MKRKSRIKISTIIPVILMLAGYYILMFPTASDLLNKIFNLNSITNYASALSLYSDDELNEMMQKCRDYNTEIAEEQSKEEFHYHGAAASDPDYESLPMSGDIGSLKIDKLGLDVTINHGTSDSNLRSGAGHLYGTSLPVDGDSVHAVIAAHSALSTAELFTNLNKLEKGDTFEITVLNKTFEYKVDQIIVCLPDEDYKYEQIEPGKNYVTLYTCTPYGVNDHRLLVRGEYTGISKTADRDGFSQFQMMKIVIRSAEFALVILGPFIAAVIYGVISDKKRRRTTCQRRK